MQVKPGWEKQKRQSLLDPSITEVAFLFAKPGAAPWAIIADHTGVEIRGDSPKFIQGGSVLGDFAWIMSEAMREYLKLKRGRIALA